MQYYALDIHIERERETERERERDICVYIYIYVDREEEIYMCICVYIYIYIYTVPGTSRLAGCRCPSHAPRRPEAEANYNHLSNTILTII